MCRNVFGLILASLFLLLLASACAPAAPAPQPAPPPAQPPATARQASAAPSPGDEAWAKVVAEAKKEGKVTLYTFLLVGDAGVKVGKAFEDKYGIPVERMTGIGTVLIERVKSEQAARKNIADTVDSAASLVLTAKDMGLTQSWGVLPSVEEKDAWKINPVPDPEGHLVGLRPTVATPYYNTRMLKAEEAPKSYRELLEPKWKKKVVVDSPVTSPLVIWVYLAMLKNGALDEGYWRQLAKQDLAIAPTIRDVATKLIQGEVPLAFVYSDGTMSPFAKEGAPVQAIEMSEGVVKAPHGTSMGLLKGAPHPNAARVFANWFLSSEGQRTYAEALGGFSPLRKDTPDLRPTVLKVPERKSTLLDANMYVEASKVQRDGTLARILGVEK